MGDSPPAPIHCVLGGAWPHGGAPVRAGIVCWGSCALPFDSRRERAVRASTHQAACAGAVWTGTYSPCRAQRTWHALSCPRHCLPIFTHKCMHTCVHVCACTRTSTTQPDRSPPRMRMHIAHASTGYAHTQASTPPHPTHPQAAPRCPPIGRRWGPRALCPRRWRARTSRNLKSEPERPGAGV